MKGRLSQVSLMSSISLTDFAEGRGPIARVLASQQSDFPGLHDGAAGSVDFERMIFGGG